MTPSERIAEIEARDSCGCVFCDLNVARENDETGTPQHYVPSTKQWFDCTNRALKEKET